MKLVDNWKRSWRWFSVQAGSLVVALPVAWTALPDDAKAIIPEAWLPYIIGAVGAAVVIGRLVDQNE